MTTLFAEVMTAVTRNKPPTEEVVEEQAQPDTPAIHRLQKRLTERQESEGVALRGQIEELQERLEVEEAVIKRFADYDLKTEAKKPDFDRSEATKLQSEALIAQEVAHGIADEIAVAQERLKSIKGKYQKVSNRLNESVRILDQTRRSTAIEFVQGRGKLKMDKDHIRRWLGQVLHIEEALYKAFPDEEDWPTVAELMDTLTTYNVPPSTTGMLYESLHQKDKHRFEKYAPDAQGEK